MSSQPLSAKNKTFLAREWSMGQRSYGELASTYDISVQKVVHAVRGFITHLKLEPDRYIYDTTSVVFTIDPGLIDRSEVDIRNQIRVYFEEHHIEVEEPPRAGRRRMLNRVRDVDQNEPRDVWLSYGVPSDPRLDNFCPCELQ